VRVEGRGLRVDFGVRVLGLGFRVEGRRTGGSDNAVLARVVCVAPLHALRPCGR